MSPARILIIAGSDPSGGAGLQADIKTVTALGGYAMAAVTALTVQNTRAVTAVEPVDPALIAQQIRAAADDIGVDAVKIGLVPTAEAAEAIAAALSGLQAPIVLDPVITASSGDRLSDAADPLKRLLIPQANLITPNLPEAAALLGRAVADEADMTAALAPLAAFGCPAVLLKGGHLAGDEVVDLLYQGPDRLHRFAEARIDTRHSHGTGCTLASAVATRLGQGAPLAQAVADARAFVRAAMAAAPGFGAGHGPLGHAQAGGFARPPR